jgi:nucleoside-diphosphate-sugar epimerase
MSRVLVVGGTGFLGENLCRRFVETGHDVHSLSRGDAQSPIDGVTYSHADLADGAAVKAALRQSAFDYVVNCGGKVDHRPLSGGGLEVVGAHLTGLLNILLTIDRAAVRRFVQVGSSDVYGSLAAPQSESNRELPFSPYSFSKAAADYLIQTLWRAEQFPGVSVRLFLIYGPGQNRERFIPQIIEGCLQGRHFKVSPGLQLRDFCYVSDAVDAISLCFDNNAVNGETLNLASGVGVTIREVVAKIQKIAQGGHPEFGALPYRAGENLALVADVEKIERLLGWQPKVSLDEGLRRSIEYYRNRE